MKSSLDRVTDSFSHLRWRVRVSLSQYAPSLGWHRLGSPVFSLFQTFPFNRRFFLLSFPGIVAIATVSFDPPAFLPSGLPLSASHQWGFTHLRNSPLKLLFQHAHDKLYYSSVRVFPDIASGATGLALHLCCIVAQFAMWDVCSKLLLNSSSKTIGICQLFVGNDTEWQTQYSSSFSVCTCLLLISQEFLFSYLWVWLVEHLSLEKHMPFQYML